MICIDKTRMVETTWIFSSVYNILMSNNMLMHDMLVILIDHMFWIIIDSSNYFYCVVWQKPVDGQVLKLVHVIES